MCLFISRYGQLYRLIPIFKPKANIHCAEDSPEEVVRLQENSHGKEELGNNAISHNKGGSYVEPALTINGLSNFVFPP